MFGVGCVSCQDEAPSTLDYPSNNFSVIQDQTLLYSLTPRKKRKYQSERRSDRTAIMVYLRTYLPLPLGFSMSAVVPVVLLISAIATPALASYSPSHGSGSGSGSGSEYITQIQHISAGEGEVMNVEPGTEIWWSNENGNRGSVEPGKVSWSDENGNRGSVEPGKVSWSDENGNGGSVEPGKVSWSDENGNRGSVEPGKVSWSDENGNGGFVAGHGSGAGATEQEEIEYRHQGHGHGSHYSGGSSNSDGEVSGPNGEAPSPTDGKTTDPAHANHQVSSSLAGMGGPVVPGLYWYWYCLVGAFAHAVGYYTLTY
ncbi:hypothetical protein V8F20_005562 [Naviculisporaceae sp. PSN 640]